MSGQCMSILGGEIGLLLLIESFLILGKIFLMLMELIWVTKMLKAINDLSLRVVIHITKFILIKSLLLICNHLIFDSGSTIEILMIGVFLVRSGIVKGGVMLAAFLVEC